MATANLPEVVDIDDESKNLIYRVASHRKNYVWVGPDRYFYPDTYKIFGPQFYNFQVRPDDIFLVGHPRTGTTWTQEMIWLINHNLDYEKAKKYDIDTRAPHLDLCLMHTPDTENAKISQIQDEEKKKFLLKVIEPAMNKLNEMPSPRFIKTHLPFSLLPSNLLDTAKVCIKLKLG